MMINLTSMERDLPNMGTLTTQLISSQFEYLNVYRQKLRRDMLFLLELTEKRMKRKFSAKCSTTTDDINYLKKWSVHERGRFEEIKDILVKSLATTPALWKIERCQRIAHEFIDELESSPSASHMEEKIEMARKFVEMIDVKQSKRSKEFRVYCENTNKVLKRLRIKLRICELQQPVLVGFRIETGLADPLLTPYILFISNSEEQFVSLVKILTNQGERAEICVAQSVDRKVRVLCNDDFHPFRGYYILFYSHYAGQKEISFNSHSLRRNLEL